MSGLRQLLKQIALAPLRFGPVRSRLAFWLNQRHYPDLDIRIPLSHRLACPIYSPEYWCSFSETFVNAEYSGALELMPLPNRWLDFGCHAGFFSLYLEWLRRKSGLNTPPECLLLDADERVAPAIRRLAEVNDVPFRFLHAGIGSGKGAMSFTERSFMASSAMNCDASGGRNCLVPVVSADALFRELPPPYDLIKADIEGSEFDLIENYAQVLSESRHLLLEWHSWHRGGGGKKQLIAMCEALGYVLQSEIQPDHEVAPGKTCGVLWFENQRLNRASLQGLKVAV